MGEERGSIGFFTTYRPPVALDIYSCPLPHSTQQSNDLQSSDERVMTDGDSYNYNGQPIPAHALKLILQSVGTEAEADSGMVFVSERTDGLETIHIALHCNGKTTKVINFGNAFGGFNGVRMEDSGCIAGEYLVYVTTKDPAFESRQPWTKVYRTSLRTGLTLRLTPSCRMLVYRSTKDHYRSEKKYKNLYIMKNVDVGDGNRDNITRLTEGNWIDTHCKWSPCGNWIAFSSNRDRPEDAYVGDEDLDTGHFGIYLVKATDKSVIIRVLTSGNDIAGHVNHPFFSPDGRSLVVTADLAAVSADPMSLPLFLHSARPYGDTFTVDINLDDIEKSKDVREFKRITHSRFENATGTWTRFSTQNPEAQWNVSINKM